MTFPQKESILSIIKFTEGDLLDKFDNGDFDFIIHGCNCQNVMGAGIAKAIADRYPEAKKADDDFHRAFIERGFSSNEMLGRHSIAYLPRTRTSGIINLYTQEFPGRIPLDERELFLDNLFIGLQSVFSKLNSLENVKIGLPLIGCGIAGMDFTDVYRVIRHALWQNHDFIDSVTIVKYSPNSN